jgi:hypothetical protein
MTFNIGIFLAIVIGAVLGWSVFSLPQNVVPEDCCKTA